MNATSYLPFSPNNDGLNDYFIPSGQSISKFQMYIYDRWGEQLFFTDDINIGWHGKMSDGSNYSTGYYNYIIYIVDELGVSHREKGTVLLN